MFGRDSDEVDDDSVFTYHTHHEHDSYRRRSWLETMGVSGFLYLAAGVVILVIIIACCCSRKRNRGQILTPATVPPVPPAPNNTLPAQYPQQQYSPYPVQAGVVNTYPVQTAYPTVTPYPAHPSHPAPSATPYPSVSPYPSVTPYPATATPYPTAAPYPTAPSAPDHNVFFGVAPPGWTPAALPPSYEQAVGDKHPAYNPHPH